MSIYSTQYKVKNPETGRQILKTKYRVQVRRSGQSLTIDPALINLNF